MKEFIVSGGDFSRDEGVLSRINLDESTGEMNLVSEHWISHPIPSMAVRGKGFTGLCLQEKSALVSFSNIILRIDLESFEILLSQLKGSTLVNNHSNFTFIVRCYNPMYSNDY